MPAGTWTDNYGNEYVSPYIPDKILGFSGIDPSLKEPSLEAPQWLLDYNSFMNNASSGVSEDADDEIVPISHEKLDDLEGGDTTGHYHLTQAEYEALVVFLEERAGGKYDNTISEDDYEKLTQILEDYNTDTENSGAVILTQAEYTKLTRLLNEMYPDNNTVEPTFFSEGEYNKITALLNAAYPNEDSTEPVFVNAATLNSLIDARIAEYIATH